MTTVAERLKVISGLSGATVAAMLLAAGTGTTMAQCLVSYSGLPTGTVVEHLLIDRAVNIGAAGYSVSRRKWIDPLEDEDVVILFG